MAILGFVKGRNHGCRGVGRGAARRDYLILFWTRVDEAERRWRPPLPLVAVAPHRTLSGLYLSTVPSGGETAYRCRVVPGMVRHERRLAVLLGASLAAGATQVRVGVAHQRRGVGPFEITVAGGGGRPWMEVQGRLHALPARVVIPMTLLQWRPSGALLPLPECAQEVAVGRPHVVTRPPAADLPFGSPFVVFAWGSTRVRDEEEGRLPASLGISVEGLHRLADPPHLLRVP